jgi:hypothetical protein
MLMVGHNILFGVDIHSLLEELRKHTFELMALRSLPTRPTDEQHAVLSHLSRQLEQVSDTNRPSTLIDLIAIAPIRGASTKRGTQGLQNREPISYSRTCYHV